MALKFPSTQSYKTSIFLGMKYTRHRRITGTQTRDLLEWTFGVYILDFILIYIYPLFFWLQMCFMARTSFVHMLSRTTWMCLIV